MVPRQETRRRARLSFCILMASAVAIGVAACAIGQPGAMEDVGVSTPAATQVAQTNPSSGSSPPTPVPIVVATPTPIPTVAAATDLAQLTLEGKTLAPNGWTAGGVTFSFRAPAVAGQVLIPQVELVKLGEEFSGDPTAQGEVVPIKDHSATAQVTVQKILPGQYRWQARFQDAETRQVGAWMAYGDGAAGFGVVGEAPVVKRFSITAVAHAIDGVPAAGEADEPAARWTVTTQVDGAIDHFALLVDHQETAPATAPAGSRIFDAAADSVALSDLDDGQWFLHLWALDKAGQSSQPSTAQIIIMRTAPRIDDVLFRSWATNPLYQTAPIQFRPSRDVKVTVSILPARSTTAIRTYNLGRQPADRDVKIAWDGKDGSGHVVSPGSYRFLIDAVDDVGNRSQALYTGLTITNKVIKISLGTQTLTAFEGDKPFLTTLVTSGGADLPTPMGKFEILEKATPFVFHSPYPRGSQFWYPDTKSNFAMLFDQVDADFIHDAPWRSKFGPGTNGPGVPGQVYTGSHGCVETPADVMPRLYPWTPLGTPVIISQ